MPFIESNVQAINQTTGGISNTPTTYAVRYTGPVTDFSTNVPVGLKTWMQEFGIGVGDMLHILAITTAGVTTSRAGIVIAPDGTTLAVNFFTLTT